MASEASATVVDAAGPGTHPGVQALGLVDEVLAGRPEKHDAKLASTVQHVCAWRREKLARREADHRAGRWTDHDERDLGTLNGVLSLVLAIQFPLGEVRWNELESARTALAELLERR